MGFVNIALTRAEPRLRRSMTTFSAHLAFFVILSALSIILFNDNAYGQCSAQRTLKSNSSRYVFPKTDSSPKQVITSAATALIWRKVNVGAFRKSSALIHALKAANCGIGDLANKSLMRHSMTFIGTKTESELVAASVADLGLHAETTSITQIYKRALRLGFQLVAAEMGPQLRLQYYDQPPGEFLNLAMEPIETSEGERVIFVVANGGAGLVLLGHDVNANPTFFRTSRFLFVRPTNMTHRSVAHKAR